MQSMDHTGTACLPTCNPKKAVDGHRGVGGNSTVDLIMIVFKDMF